MAISGIKFTIDADNTKSLSAIKQVMYAAKDAGKQMQEAFGSKLKQVISVAAIEEGIRRTAEWADTVDKFSKSLGISREAMQTLDVISKRTGTNMDDVKNMFENINKGRMEALKGNQELIKSFAKLGITMADLKSSTPSQLFSKTMANINLQNADNLTRQSIQTITGTPENVLSGFQKGMEGRSFEETQGRLLQEGSIQSEGDVAGIATQYNEIKASLSELGTSMAPLVGILLGIVKMMVDALSGVFDVLNEFGGILIGIITLDGKKIMKSFNGLFELFANLGYGLMKFVTSMIELIPGVKKLGMTKKIQEIQDAANKEWGSNEKYVKHGQAMGEMVGNALGGEALGVAGRAIGRSAAGSKVINTALKPSGLELRVYKKGEKAWTQYTPREREKFFEFDIHGNPQTPPLKKKIDDLLSKPSLTDAEELRLANYEAKWNKGMVEPGNTSKLVRMGEQNKLKSAVIKGFHKFGKNLPFAVGNIFSGMLESEGARGRSSGISERGPITTPYMGGIGSGIADIGGSNNLKIGGMFGQSTNKLIKLNTDMVTLLGLIKDNTSFYANNNQLLGGGSNNFGGVTGGL